MRLKRLSYQGLLQSAIYTGEASISMFAAFVEAQHDGKWNSFVSDAWTESYIKVLNETAKLCYGQ